VARFGEVARKVLLGFGGPIDEAGVIAVSELVGSSHYSVISLGSLRVFAMTGEILETLSLHRHTKPSDGIDCFEGAMNDEIGAATERNERLTDD
jgi:hypothetical protein